jgi:hypothetical protein
MADDVTHVEINLGTLLLLLANDDDDDIVIQWHTQKM